MEVRFNGNRRLLVVSFESSWVASPPQEFAALVPGWTPADILDARTYFSTFVALGSCLEICCVGPRSEELHDALDEVVEDRDQLSLVTTWDVDPEEGCDWFLRLSGTRPQLWVAFAKSNPDLVRTLVEVATGEAAPLSSRD